MAGAEKAESPTASCKAAWGANQHSTAYFPDMFATGLRYPTKEDSDLLAQCFCSPISHTANLQSYLGSGP